MTISLCFSKIKIKTQQLCPFPHIMMQLLKKTRKNNKACCKQFVIGTIFSVTFNHWWEGAWRFLLHSDICGWCLVPPWNCLHQGLWAVFFLFFFIQVTLFVEILQLNLSNVVFQHFVRHKATAMCFHYIQEKADFSTADVSPTRFR